MAAYGSFHQIFESSGLNKSPKSLLDTLSSSLAWNPTKGHHVTTDHNETPPFTEIFGELHFRESSTHSSHHNYDKTSAENSSLQLCTEGLGSESYYDLEDEKVNVNVNFNGNGEDDNDDEIEVLKGKDNGSSDEEEWGPRRKERPREYPPAMTRMSFKTYRKEGRLVLEEVRIRRREFLQASREGGRLRLKLVQPEDDDDGDEDKEEEENFDKQV